MLYKLGKQKIILDIINNLSILSRIGGLTTDKTIRRNYGITA